MCVVKIDPKTLERICKEAIDADKSSAEKEVKSYEKKVRQQSYEPIYDKEGT